MDRLHRAALKGKSIVPHIRRLKNEGATIILRDPKSADLLNTCYKVSVRLNDRFIIMEVSRRLFKELQDESN